MLNIILFNVNFRVFLVKMYFVSIFKTEIRDYPLLYQPKTRKSLK